MRQLKINKQLTTRNTEALDKYLSEISKIRKISVEEEILLAQQIKQGNQSSLDKLVHANLRFVVSVAKQYQNQGLSLSDLINEGNLGLIKAAKRFDETRGFKFISYAVWWVRQSILHALAEQARIVRLPVNRITSINKINSTFALLEQEYQREPTAEEIANTLDIAHYEVKESFKTMDKHISMDAPLRADGNINMYDTLLSADQFSPDNNLLTESLRREIENSLSTLSPKEAEIIRMYFGLNGEIPSSLEEIGSTLNITKERVRQIKEKAIKRLKHSFRNHMLRPYLGE